jgi:thioredoxin-related protein
MKNVRFGVQFILLSAVLIAFVLLPAGCDKKANTQTVAASAAAGGGHQDSGIEWLTDWEKAKQTAAAENKDLLIDFSGSDWCGWCKKLDAEVFTKPEFAAVSEDFILVLVDFPNDKSGQSEQLQQQNERLSKEFELEYFPTIFLADSEGKPYAKTGYVEGGPKAYLQHLEELKKQK